MISFRLLRSDEVEARIFQSNQYGVQVLLYKNARADMSLLDECIGAENWQRKHELINGSLFCSVGVRVVREDGSAEWIWRQDVGSESNTEKEKGQASDSFKRACTCFGAGRELYTSPRIFVKAKDLKSLEERNGRWICRDTFDVEDIQYEGRRISSVTIKNESTGKSLTFGSEKITPSKIAEEEGVSFYDKIFLEKRGRERIGQREIDRLTAACANRTDGRTLDKAIKACNKTDVRDITFMQYLSLCQNLGISA